MIEKFTDEEISQILKELGIAKQPVPRKSVVLAEQKARIARIFKKELYPGTGEKKPNGTPVDLIKRSVHKEVFDAIVTIIDYTIENLDLGMDRYRNPEYRRATTIMDGDAKEYKEIFGEILDVIEKHHN